MRAGCVLVPSTDNHVELILNENFIPPVDILGSVNIEFKDFFDGVSIRFRRHQVDGSLDRSDNWLAAGLDVFERLFGIIQGKEV